MSLGSGQTKRDFHVLDLDRGRRSEDTEEEEVVDYEDLLYFKLLVFSERESNDHVRTMVERSSKIEK